MFEKQAVEKGEHKKQIVKFFETNSKADNNDVQKLLGVADATAERYLNELEREGKIKQNGDTGKAVYYTKI